MKYLFKKKLKFIYFGFLAILSFLGTHIQPVSAGVIYQDDFNGSLDLTAWNIELGCAWTENGWVFLHRPKSGCTPPDPWRDSIIITGEGSDWSDYHFSTRFYAEGGGQNWYMAIIQFRVQEMYGWGQGTYYRLNVFTPLWNQAFKRNKVYLSKQLPTGQAWVVEALAPEGVMNDHDNVIEVEIIGGVIQIAVNGVHVLEHTDPDPILFGGVGIGSIWESTTRYDYVTVEPIETVEVSVSHVLAPDYGWLESISLVSFPATVGTEKVSVTVEATADSGISSVMVNDIEAVGGPTQWVAEGVTLDEGENTVIVTAVSNNGVEESTEIEIQRNSDFDGDGIANNIDCPTSNGGGPYEMSFEFSDQKVQGLGMQPKGIVFSPEGTRAYISNMASGSVSVISTATREVLANIPLQGETDLPRRPQKPAIRPDGSELLIPLYDSRAGAVAVIDTITNQVVEILGGKPETALNPYLTSITLSPDGNRAVAIAHQSGWFSLVDALSFYWLDDRRTSDFRPACAVISQSGAAFIGFDDRLYKYDISSDTLQGINANVFNSDVGLRGVALTPDESIVWATEAQDNQLTAFNANDLRGIRSIYTGGNDYPFAVGITPDGRLAFTTNYQSSKVTVVDISDPSNPLLVTRIDVGANPTDVAILPDGSEAWVVNSSASSVTVIDTDLLEVMYNIGVTDPNAGTTFGIIEEIGDQVLTLTDLQPENAEGVSPRGIRVQASGGDLNLPAVLYMCPGTLWGNFWVDFRNGYDLQLYCSSLGIKVTEGVGMVRFTSRDGFSGSLTLKKGDSAHIDYPVTGLDSQSFEVTAPAENQSPIMLTFSGETTTIPPGAKTSHSDNDGIEDSQDDCATSDLTKTVVIDGCDSGVFNWLSPEGCTIADNIEDCAKNARNHGKFVSCVGHLTNDLKKYKIITGKEKGAIQSCAAHANIP